MGEHLSQELRVLVRESVAILGEVIYRKLGSKNFNRIEETRKKMTHLRKAPLQQALNALRKTSALLAGLDESEQVDFAKAFTLMLETMNACENSYRSHRLRQENRTSSTKSMDAIVYVLTAHPTEARSPENIAVFREIQGWLIRTLDKNQGMPDALTRTRLRHLFELAWAVSLGRSSAPQVEDEANHIYSILFEPEILRALLEFSGTQVPVYIRSWVGGDKDGHPGVDECTLRNSLGLSRGRILGFLEGRLARFEETLELLKRKPLERALRKVRRRIQTLRYLRPGDGDRAIKLRAEVRALAREYELKIGDPHPILLEIRQLFRVFPALVVPLELRESSDLILLARENAKLAIVRMLREVRRLAGRQDPKWYARGFIISMTSSIEQIRAATDLVESSFGSARIPVIPLFETHFALESSSKIVREMLSDRRIRRAIFDFWDGQLEIMMGYSDSSKESGVLPSRLAISETMSRLDSVCRNARVKPIFFQGSGGSVDRGGGSIQEQTAWWPRSALRNYKVTVQGEMVERSLATPEIAQGQWARILQSASRTSPARVRAPKDLELFANRVSELYRMRIRSEAFLNLVQRATPYPVLSELRIGSRPAKRSTTLSVQGLRAIPWVLCWTQTRILFPTWWGIGTAWSEADRKSRTALSRAYRELPVFTSYVKALGFTLAKVELPIWRLYLESSTLEKPEIERAFSDFREELGLSKRFYHAITGERHFVASRPWLEESIELRSPMIHPLNLLQIQALRHRRQALLRLTVTGISSGMLTTG